MEEGEGVEGVEGGGREWREGEGMEVVTCWTPAWLRVMVTLGGQVPTDTRRTQRHTCTYQTHYCEYLRIFT